MNKKLLYGLILVVIVIVAIGTYFYLVSTTDKLKITSFGKSGALINDYLILNFTITISNIGRNDVTGAYLMIRLYHDHNEVPIVGSNSKELGTLKAGWEQTDVLTITVRKDYYIDCAEAVIYLGDKILDREILYF